MLLWMNFICVGTEPKWSCILIILIRLKRIYNFWGFLFSCPRILSCTQFSSAP
jgi:hypothetical protein